MENPMPFLGPSLIGQGKVNQLGGSYINGRPLSAATRRAIVDMYLQNEKPCNISRILKISHGAVSKIVTRYIQTGSIQPGQIGGTARTRKTIVQFSKEIIGMKTENPDIQPKEIRNTLIKNGLCNKDDAPTESSIARKLTAFKREKVAKVKKENKPDIPRDLHPKQQQSPSILHSIDQILGCSNASQSNIANNNNSTSTISTSNSAALSSNDESYTDDEDSTVMSRNENRRNRTAFTQEQINILEKCFDTQMYPSENEKQQIIKATGLDLTKINTWFSNRRARARKSCVMSTDLPLPSQQLPSTTAISSFPTFTFPTDLAALFQPQNSSPTLPFPHLPLYPFDPQTALLFLSKLQQQK